MWGSPRCIQPKISSLRSQEHASGSSPQPHASILHSKDILLLPVLKFSSNPNFFGGETAPLWAKASSFTRFLGHTQRRSIFGRTPLDEWSARRLDLYLTTHNRQTSMPALGFEPTISAGERPQTYNLESAATGIGSDLHRDVWNGLFSLSCCNFIHAGVSYYDCESVCKSGQS